MAGAAAWYTTHGSEAATQQITAALRAGGVRETPRRSVAGTVLVVGEPAPGLLTRVGELAAAGPVLVVLRRSGDADPWELLAAGAGDVVVWSSATALDDLKARLDRWAVVEALVDSERVRRVAVGASPAWRSLLRSVVEAARFTTSPVLLTGETGTGKELVARLVHELDPRPHRGELVLVDCTTIVPSLSGSELFGHEKGAFTGATALRPGAFELADGGTLFLDEVGELSSPMQAELLRVVQEGVFKRVGGTRWQSARFRLVAATHRDLCREQEAGTFRRDLYFRLAAAVVRLPPLEDRLEDVVPLFRHFLGETRSRASVPEVAPAVVDLLVGRAYPGNVRDLRQLALRVAARHVGPGPITPGDVPPEDRPPLPGRPPRPAGGPAVHAPSTSEPPERGPVLPAPRSVEPGDDDWTGRLEAAVREALRAGTGLKQLRAVVGDVATRVALDEAGTPGQAARLLKVSRRAVEYRTAGGARPLAAAATSAVETRDA